jgi:hypothetical protein
MDKIKKGQFFYDDCVLRQRTDARAPTIQIGIGEVVRFPRIIDNLSFRNLTLGSSRC